MKVSTCYDGYPLRTVLIANVQSLSIYGLGVYVFLQAGPILAVAYVAYVVWKELRLLSTSCRHCFYFGKTCMSGRGRLAAMFLPKGDGARFAEKQLTWKDLIPDLFVSLAPVIAAVVLMIVNFTWDLLVAVALIVALTTWGNAFVRKQLACPYCKQRELGCPAEKLFAARAKPDITHTAAG